MMPVTWRLWEGQVVDLYFPLRRYLGGGERSAVYLTQIGDPPRNAVIKLIAIDSEERDAAVQWDRAAQLSHPHLLPLLRTARWQVNQLPLRYAVSEYAEENLADVLADRPLAAAEARAILNPLLDALASIHGEGLVHGHVKPANILAVGDELKLSVDGITLVGEPGIMPAASGPYDPPEFSERGCSPVGDVWSFGVTMVEALTRKRPVLTGPKQDPVLPEGLPEEFLPLVRACLRSDPRRRATIEEIRELLERPKAPAIEKPVEHRPATPRRWARVALAAGAAVVLAAILAGPRLLRRPPANAETGRTAVVPVTTPAPAPAEIPKADKPTPFPPVVAPVPAAKPEPAPPVSAPAPAREPAVDAGQGEIARQVLPEVPDAARRSIHGKVKIQVRATVDAEGHVGEAKVESQNSRYFAKLAVDAARQWEFTGGSGDWILRFEFTTAGTTVRPSRVGR